MSPCRCRCHLGGAYPSCDVDAGISGVPGVAYCGPHTDGDVTMRCDRCGVAIGAPHVALDTDCILDHGEHVDRYIGFLCRRHYGWLGSMLTEIEELGALLPDVLLPGPSGAERRGTNVESPAPGRLEVMALTDRRAKTPIDLEAPDDIPDFPGTLASWARMVAEERERGDDLGAATIAGSVRMLRGERQWIAQQPWVDDYARELHDLHRSLARAVGDSMWPKSIGDCPNCGTALYNTIGVDVVVCRRCAAQWSGVHLARLRFIHEQEAK